MIVSISFNLYIVSNDYLNLTSWILNHSAQISSSAKIYPKPMYTCASRNSGRGLNNQWPCNSTFRRPGLKGFSWQFIQLFLHRARSALKNSDIIPEFLTFYRLNCYEI